MTIEQYLQDKVDINEITTDDMRNILRQVCIISHKQDFNTDELRDAVICSFLLDFNQSEMFLKKTDKDLEKDLSEIVGYSKQHLLEVLDELVNLHILILVRDEDNKDKILYKLNKDIKTEDAKKIAIIRANNIYMIYKNYYDDAFNQIENVLISIFGFEITNNNGVLNFEMGGNGYNVYLSRGYIVLEAEDNSTIENVYTADTVDDFIELINDLLEDK